VSAGCTAYCVCVCLGCSLLLVGVLGPAGPCNEVSVRRLDNTNNIYSSDTNNATTDRSGQYVVSYCPSIVGPHTIVVKWGDQHIPGSPFNVNVVSH